MVWYHEIALRGRQKGKVFFSSSNHQWYKEEFQEGIGNVMINEFFFKYLSYSILCLIFVCPCLLNFWSRYPCIHEQRNHYEQFEDVPVGKRGDDEPLCATEELVLVLKVYVCDGDDSFICVLVEIKPWLLQPLKITGRLDVHSALEEQKYNTQGVELSDTFRKVTAHLH